MPEVRRLPALRRCCGQAFWGPGSAGRGRGSFVAPGPPGRAGHFRSLPRASGSEQRRHPQVRRLRPELPTVAAPPSSVVSQGWAPTPTAPAVKLMEDKGGGCWGRVLPGSPRGPLSASSQKSAFCGNHTLRNSISKFPYLCQLILMEK